MMHYGTIIPLLVSFFVTLFLLPFWMRKAKELGLVWGDMNKTGGEKIAGSGGLIVGFGFIAGILVYIAYRVFVLNDGQLMLVQTFALLSVCLILTGIGFVDDLFGWLKGGLSRRSRLILVLMAAVPLVAINAGRSIINLPLFGPIDFGVFYPLILIPLGIVGATTTFNFLAGFNGLEAGQGIIILSALAIVSYFTGSPWLSVIALCMVLALFAFLIFNFCPAKVFPGDSLTYPVGGLIAIMAILGNFEKVAVFFFIPVIIEFFLKARGKFIKQSFGKPLENRTLDLKYNKVYGLTHFAIFLMKKFGIKPTEIRVVILIWIFQIVVILAGFIIFKEGIF